MQKTFKISSGAIRITDPCYDETVWCAGTVENVKNGDWVHRATYTEDWGKRVESLTIAHSDFAYLLEQPQEVDWVEVDSYGVDSGQLGFFDFVNWKAVATEGELKYEEGSWYRNCCKLTHPQNVPYYSREDDIHARYAIMETMSDTGELSELAKKHYAEDLELSRRKEAEAKAIYEAHPYYGVIDWGVVSSSGLGDGGYSAYKITDEYGQIVGLRVWFLNNPTWEDEENFDNDIDFEEEDD